MSQTSTFGPPSESLSLSESSLPLSMSPGAGALLECECALEQRVQVIKAAAGYSFSVSSREHTGLLRPCDRVCHHSNPPIW